MEAMPGELVAVALPVFVCEALEVTVAVALAVALGEEEKDVDTLLLGVMLGVAICVLLGEAVAEGV